jgi:aspartate/methionine/tyrosine aminotransferase
VLGHVSLVLGRHEPVERDDGIAHADAQLRRIDEGILLQEDPNAAGFYAVLDLEVLGTRRYGRSIVDWLLDNKNPLEILFRVAEEGGVVLLPGRGFGTPHPSARISLANLNEADYAKIGRIIRNIMQEYADEYHNQTGRSAGQGNGDDLNPEPPSRPAD